MVDAVSHITGPGTASAAGTTGQSAHMVGRDQLPQEGNPQADAQAGTLPGAFTPLSSSFVSYQEDSQLTWKANKAFPRTWAATALSQSWCTSSSGRECQPTCCIHRLDDVSLP